MHLLNRSPSPLGAVWRLQQGRPQGIDTRRNSSRRQHVGPGPDSDGQCGEEGTRPQRYPGGRLTAGWQNWLRKEEGSVVPGAPDVGNLCSVTPGPGEDWLNKQGTRGATVPGRKKPTTTTLVPGAVPGT